MYLGASPPGIEAEHRQFPGRICPPTAFPMRRGAPITTWGDMVIVFLSKVAPNYDQSCPGHGVGAGEASQPWMSGSV